MLVSASSHVRSTAILAAIFGLGLACRSTDPNARPQPSAQAQDRANAPADADDGRVEPGPLANEIEPPPPDESRGRGTPDETNGECRLYAPQLPSPKCCPYEFGFDAVKASEICGRPVYLGESMHQTCGYHYFAEDGQTPVFFRVSAVAGDTVEDAVRDHDRMAQAKLRKPDFKSTPVPGVDGAYWSRSEEGEMNWAFIPGWKEVRRVTWQDGACSQENMAKLLPTLIAAKQPAANAPRIGMIPVARQ